jgi:acyl-CoA thioesterase
MLEQDLFSQWLGINIIEQRDGFLKIKMQVRPEMCNAFNIIHGGVIFSFADSALAYISNASGRHAVSIESSISNLKSVYSGELIYATASRIREGNSISVFNVQVTRQGDELIADFKGTVLRKGGTWNEND